jgi:hypothetical protein
MEVVACCLTVHEIPLATGYNFHRQMVRLYGKFTVFELFLNLPHVPEGI